jgi:hypothetical protein
VSADQEPGNRSPADGGVPKVACNEKSRLRLLKTLNQKRPFLAVHVHQASGSIFRNIRPLEARAKGSASSFRGGALLWSSDGVRRLSELLATKGSR